MLDLISKNVLKRIHKRIAITIIQKKMKYIEIRLKFKSLNSQSINQSKWWSFRHSVFVLYSFVINIVALEYMKNNAKETTAVSDAFIVFQRCAVFILFINILLALAPSKISTNLFFLSLTFYSICVVLLNWFSWSLTLAFS